MRAEYGWKLGDNLRILNPAAGLYSGNRLVVVDRRVSLVGSANWTQSSVTKNREMCVLIDSGEIANWYLKLFEFDWSVGLKTMDEIIPDETIEEDVQVFPSPL